MELYSRGDVIIPASIPVLNRQEILITISLTVMWFPDIRLAHLNSHYKTVLGLGAKAKDT